MFFELQGCVILLHRQHGGKVELSYRSRHNWIITGEFLSVISLPVGWFW